jgi:hypothetical protein
MKIIIIDKPKGMYLLDEINKMIVVVFKQQGYTF